MNKTLSDISQPREHLPFLGGRTARRYEKGRSNAFESFEPHRVEHTRAQATSGKFFARVSKSIHAYEDRPPTPTDIAQKAVEDAYWILDLPEGWNEDGAPAYQRSEMDRLRNFLVALLEEGREWGIPNKAPDINPAASGGIDLCWDSSETSMAINVSSEPGGPITFYYERQGGLAAKGWWIFEG